MAGTGAVPVRSVQPSRPQLPGANPAATSTNQRNSDIAIVNSADSLYRLRRNIAFVKSLRQSMLTPKRGRVPYFPPNDICLHPTRFRGHACHPAI